MSTDSMNIIKTYGRKDGDSGSPEVQIAFFTQRINSLTEHLKENKKDLHSRYGLVKIVNKRKKMLAYLKEKDTQRYLDIIGKLNLRK